MRNAGILMHPSSIPHHGPCGDLGPDAFRFLDWLNRAGISLWQTLPLHPPGGGFSPYSSHSAFAGAIYLISLDLLIDKGLLKREETLPRPNSHRITLSHITDWKIPLIYKAADTFAKENRKLLKKWMKDTHWAEDWALFQAIKHDLGVDGWQQFPQKLIDRDKSTLLKTKKRLDKEIFRELAAQYLFFEQWNQLKKAANERNIQIVGDMPIFIASDGCDAWTHRSLFRWDANNWPDPVSGAPPDHFSEMGQHWGNPLYNWEAHRKEKFAWWVRRIQGELAMSDWIRIDHFRGFCAAWEIPRTANGDARKGSWGASPGKELFAALKRELGELPFIAEDLGVITEDVDALREDLQLMGMKVLQFAFDDYTHMYLPHSFENSLFACYTGTHDNDTCIGWYHNTSNEHKHRYRVYVGRDGSEPHWDLIRLAWSSVAQWSITTMQDALGLDGSARMNVPGVSGGNWSWRAHDLPEEAANRLRSLCEAYGRLPEQNQIL